MGIETKPEEAFRLPRLQGGRACEIYFFRSWSGYAHPVRPVDPVPWTEALSGEGHCQALYCGDANGARLEAFRAVSYSRTPWRGSPPARVGAGADHYFQVIPDGEVIRVGRELDPASAAEADAFLFVRWRNSGQLDRAEVAAVSRWYRYEYAYDGAGRLLRAVIRNPERTTQLDY